MERYEADANGALAELYAFIIQARKSQTRSLSRLPRPRAPRIPPGRAHRP